MVIFLLFEVILGWNKDRHCWVIDHVIVLEHVHEQSKCLVLEIVHGLQNSMDMVKSHRLNGQLKKSTLTLLVYRDRK